MLITTTSWCEVWRPLEEILVHLEKCRKNVRYFRFDARLSVDHFFPSNHKISSKVNHLLLLNSGKWLSFTRRFWSTVHFEI